MKLSQEFPAKVVFKTGLSFVFIPVAWTVRRVNQSKRFSVDIVDPIN